MTPTLMYRRFDAILQSACKSVNDTVGPDGFVPTLLVYVAIKSPGSTLSDPHI